MTTIISTQPFYDNGQNVITVIYSLADINTYFTTFEIKRATDNTVVYSAVFSSPTIISTTPVNTYGITNPSSSISITLLTLNFNPGSLPNDTYYINVVDTMNAETPIQSDMFVYNGSGGGGGAICFLGNAPVLTPAGYKRIDSLAAGDMVRTADGRDVAIQRVKHQRVISPSAAVNPYVIPKGQFGATQNLAISPRHCVAVPGHGMVEARDLGLRQLSMKAAFDYYNLELPEWDNMVVAGVEVESLAPKKRVVVTAAQFRELVGGRSVDLARLARIATVRADGMVDVTLTRKARRLV